jgi:hypothetical protein
VGAEIFRTHPELPWDPHNLLHNGYRFFSREQGDWGEVLVTHPIPALRLRICWSCNSACLHRNVIRRPLPFTFIVEMLQAGKSGVRNPVGRDFPDPTTLARIPLILLYNGQRVPFLRVNQPGRGTEHPPHSSDGVKYV